MLKVVPILFCFLFANTVCAQIVNFEWAINTGGTLDDGTYAVTTDAAGNVYTVGEFKGNVDFDPGPGTFFLNTGTTFSNSFILKLSPGGNFIWARQIRQLSTGDNLAGNIIIDATGAIYYSAQLFGMVDADPGPGIFPLGNPGSLGEAFITKLDAAGNFLWARIWSGNNAGITEMAFDPAGNLFATGFFQGTIDFDPGPVSYPLVSNGGTDIFVLKLDMNGNFLWAGAMGFAGSNDDPYGLKVNSAGDVFCTGTFSGTIDFDPGPGVFILSTSGVPTFNTFILKLSNTGSFMWAKQIVGSASNIGLSLTIDNNENILLAGTIYGTADLDPGPGTSLYTSAGVNDIYILKLNPSGDFIWAKQVGGASWDWVNTMVADQTGAVYLTGAFSSVVDFDPGPAVANLTSSGASDVYVLKLDQAGNFAWVKQIMGSGATEFGIGLWVDPAYSVYVSGYYQQTADFDPGPAVYNLTSNGQRDGFILKLSKCTQVLTSTLTITACDTYTLNGQTYTASGTYTQTLVNTLGCDSIITLNLTIGRKFTSVNAAICEGQSYFAGGALQTAAGVYKDTLLTSLGCDSIITTTLTVNPRPTPDLGPDRKLCQNTPTFITPGSFNAYIWQDNSNQSSFAISAPGLYWVTVTDANNCQATDSLRVLSIDTLPNNFLPADQVMCFGNELKISLAGYKEYLWSAGSTASAISLRSFGTFYLTVKDFNNCTGTDSITLIRANCIPIGIPNAFTPNGDNLNDVFRPTINQAIQRYHFAIYNRYGELVFETAEYGKGWDGTYKGKKQPTGSYVYRIVFTNINGWESENNGSFLLIR